jgi:ATP-binding cassette subfamily C (CFTR/MRP) protein 1
MTGFASSVSAKITDSRLSEIQASRRHRVLNIFVTLSCEWCLKKRHCCTIHANRRFPCCIVYASSALAPVWGFGAYILIARSSRSGTQTLTESVAFSALSIFELLNQPLIYIVESFEHIQTIVNSFERIQEYLESEEREDLRIISAASSPRSPTLDPSSQETHEKTGITVSSAKLDMDTSKFAAIVKDASAKYSSDGPVILDHLTFDIPRGQTTMVFGPVGSGKSTLLKLLLGEAAPDSGSVSTFFSRASFCSQSPWITQGTIQSNIVGMSPWDKAWYDTVVEACALLKDLRDMPNGDQTNTGSRGSQLSGGQQMRLVIHLLSSRTRMKSLTSVQSFARALYSKNEFIILDDVLTGLDWTTERSILDAVFASNGLFKRSKSTVVLTTNSGNFSLFYSTAHRLT